ncbi:3',5'-cyclic-nucleotide phosphodiesterase, partial [Candida maltosa Xu316]
MSFEITFLGSSGGPLEGSTCSILLKSVNISYEKILESHLTDELLCIDAGSGMGKLTEIIHQESTYQQSSCNLLYYYPDCEPISYYYHPSVTVTSPFKDFTPNRSLQHTQKIYNHLTNYLITHSHLDHVSALVVNSAGFNKKYSNKIVYGAHCTINALQKHLFNGKIWPNMPSFNIVDLRYLETNRHSQIGKYNISMFDLSHGEFSKLTEDPDTDCLAPLGKANHRRTSITTIPQNSNGSAMKNSEALNQHYLSSAFLVSRNKSNLLVFGDFESDLTSKLTRNLYIWQRVAPLIINQSMAGIVLECSNSFEIDPDQLYGHLTPKLLIYELKQLANACFAIDPSINQPLQNLNIIVTHVKEPIFDDDDIELSDPRKKILTELNKLNEMEKLGCNFSIALSGTSIII